MIIYTVSSFYFLCVTDDVSFSHCSSLYSKAWTNLTADLSTAHLFSHSTCVALLSAI